MFSDGIIAMETLHCGFTENYTRLIFFIAAKFKKFTNGLLAFDQYLLILFWLWAELMHFSYGKTAYMPKMEYGMVPNKKI